MRTYPAGLKLKSKTACTSVYLSIYVCIVYIARHQNQVNKRFVKMSKVQCLEAAVAADNKVQKALAAAQGPSSTADHPFEGKAYVQVSF